MFHRERIDHEWYLQLRAVICKWFPGYTFSVVDALPFEKVFELYASAEWLSDQESKATEHAKGKKGRR